MSTLTILKQAKHLTGAGVCCLWALLAASVTLASPAATDGPNRDIFGRWRVVSILDTADVAGMSNKQAQNLVGKSIRIDAHAFSFAGTDCKTPTYERQAREPAQYLREQWHARVGLLGLPDPVTVIDARCTDLFLKPGAHMVFNWDGFFFEARRD